MITLLGQSISRASLLDPSTHLFLRKGHEGNHSGNTATRENAKHLFETPSKASTAKDKNFKTSRHKGQPPPKALSEFCPQVHNRGKGGRLLPEPNQNPSQRTTASWSEGLQSGCPLCGPRLVAILWPRLVSIFWSLDVALRTAPKSVPSFGPRRSPRCAARGGQKSHGLRPVAPKGRPLCGRPNGPAA